jgi:hypothetical protein
MTLRVIEVSKIAEGRTVARVHEDPTEEQWGEFAKRFEWATVWEFTDGHWLLVAEGEEGYREARNSLGETTWTELPKWNGTAREFWSTIIEAMNATTQRAHREMTRQFFADGVECSAPLIQNLGRRSQGGTLTVAPRSAFPALPAHQGGAR